MTKYKNVLVAAGIVVLGYLLRDALKQKFHIPLKSTPDNIALNITLISTNDLHSSFSGLGLRSYPEQISGGYSRLVTLIDSVRSKKIKEDDIVLTLDAGDWYSGSLFDHLGADTRTSSVPQMQFFDAAQFDAIIFGNHDFDRYETALFAMLDKAQKLHLNINVIVSNLLTLSMESKFQQFYDPTSTVKFLPYLIKETSRGKVGVLGYITPDALFVSNDYRDELQFLGYSHKDGIQYDKLLELAAEQSEMLKKELKCDVVVAVIHGGHKDKEDIGFLNLPNIDVVLGGHSHESYLHASDDSSLSSQCGFGGMSLTALSFGVDSDRELHFRGVDDEYHQFVDKEYPQCIKVSSKFTSDVAFEQKVKLWKGEIDDLLDVEMDKVVFQGDLSSLLQLSMSHAEMAVSFAHMLVSEFNKWGAITKPGSDPVIATFWNREFFEIDELTQSMSDVAITYDDAYNLIFFPALKDLYTCYMTKEELYYILQGTFIVRRLVSPLLYIDAGGIVYTESNYFGIPFITDLKTIGGLEYADWPPMVKVLANSISAPYLWKIDTWTRGFLQNFPKDKIGNPMLMDEGLEVNSPKELGLFINYLGSLNETLV